jgi:uncharacterized protein (TIGR02284 family)
VNNLHIQKGTKMNPINMTLDITEGSLAHLRDIFQMNIDSRDGFAYAAERLADKHSDLSKQFKEYSEQRNRFAMTLRELIQLNNDYPATRGTIAASLHRTWMELRDEFEAIIDVSGITAEAIRGEGYIKESYEAALNSIGEPSVRAIIGSQYESICESYFWLKEKVAEQLRSQYE